MNTEASKGSKPFVIKVIIVVMSLLFMLGPIHLEINRFLHTIVHTLEMPDTILSHQKRSNAPNIHQSIEHKIATVQHHHEVIDLVEKILEGSSNGSESTDALQSIDKIDKHLTVGENIDEKDEVSFLIEAIHSIAKIDNKLCKGYPSGFGKPPELIISVLI